MNINNFMKWHCENNRWRYFYIFLLLTCLIATLFYITGTLFGSYAYAFHSDDAVKTVLARLSIDDGKLVSHEWVYANGDFFIISPYIFSVILYPWLGISYFANAMASWLAYIFLLASVYGACRLVAPNRPRGAIIATVLTAGGLSAANFEFVIAQGAYSMYAAMALCLFSLASAGSLKNDRKNFIITLALAAIAASLVCVSNSTRGVITIVGPLIIGWGACTLITPKPTLRRRILRLHSPLIYAIAVGAIIGTLVYKYALLPHVLNYEAAARVGLASTSEMWQHCIDLPKAWFEYFQISSSWHTLSLAFRVLQSAIWLIAGALILSPLCILLTPTRHARGIFTLSWIVLVCYGVSFSAMVVSPHLFSSMLDMRYATFPIYGSACIVALSVDGFALRWPRIGSILLLVLAFISVSVAAVRHTEYRPGAPGADSGSSYAQRMALIKALEADNVGTILAPYWNSHVLTVLSDGKVDGYPVSVDTMLHPFAHHMPRRVFHGPAGTKQAVVLSGAEASPQAWQAVEYQLGAPYERLTVGPYSAWIYNRDITQAVLETGQEIDLPISENLLDVRLSRTILRPCAGTTACTATIDVTNLGRHVLASVGFLPLRLAMHGIDGKGEIILQDAGRADFPTAIEQGSTKRVVLSLPASTDPRVAAYQICLLQERVAWLCANTHGPVR